MEGRVIHGVIGLCSHLDNTKRFSCQMVCCIGDKCQKIYRKFIAGGGGD